jgi:hypothetical protein
MKLNPTPFLALILVFVSVINLYAQKGKPTSKSGKNTVSNPRDNTLKDPLKGIWEFTQFEINGDVPATTGTAIFKIFDGYGNFYVVNTLGLGDGAIITHRGKYKIISGSTYIEDIIDTSNDTFYKLKGVKNKIQYKIDNDSMLIQFNMEQNLSEQKDSFSETWRKVTVSSSNSMANIQ